MDSKRKGEEAASVEVKKKKLENCPHAERCYRRNPHHFREYEHAYLEEFLHQDEDKIEFPSNFQQDKNVYIEQLKILKGLKNIKPKKTQNQSVTKNNLHQPEQSSSKTTIATKKKITKTTIYVPNMQKLSTSSPNNMKERLEKAAPYNIFFTKVPKASQTMKAANSISFPDLICPSLGVLENSLQLNFMIDIMWLQEQYQVQGLEKKPMTILYGYEFPKMKEYMDLKMPHVTHQFVQMKDPFGIHHSKIGVYSYEDESLRIVISTANLYYEDWNHYNQGLWISPKLPKLNDESQDFACSGPTNFKSAFLTYLRTYKVPALEPWINKVKRADFSEVKVCFISSTPGKHYPKDMGCHLHRVGHLLSTHCILPEKTTPQSEGPLSWGVNAQASSIGSLGKSPGEWLRSVLLRSLSSHKKSPLSSSSSATLNVIYPCARNVMYSLFGAEGGGCLPYAKTVNDKQKWLQDYLHEWKADSTGRSGAMPHIKSYCRVSPCLSKLAWFLLTSANMSKSAWGGNIQKDSGCYVRSYEAGVLFLPNFFEEEYFNINSESGNEKIFPFMYDLPLTPYKSNDEPWCN